MSFLQKYAEGIRSLCAAHKVRKLYAFGSVLTERFGNNSDVDLVVEFEPIPINDYADNYFDFKFSLQDILKRQVDLLEESAISNPLFRNAISESKQLVYEH